MIKNRYKKQGLLQVIPLGGAGEIGKNMFVIRFKDEIIVLDAGLQFPEEEMLGVDIVIPDITYLLENQSRIKGIILTHGHEDHIGAMPYILEQLTVPVYGTRLTLGLLQVKLEEHHPLEPVQFHEIEVDRALTISKNFELEFFRTNHSIPDSVGVAVHNPAGTLVYTSDFKFDQTPVDGLVTDFYKLAELGRRGVLVTLIDSTNSERPGVTLSEKVVGQSIDEIFRLSHSRIVFATFASNIHRIQQVIHAAHLYGRKLCVVGRSIENTVEIASKMGYLDIPPGMLVEVEKIGRIADDQIAIVTTGSQGEPMSGLTRMSQSDHRRVEIKPGDTVIIAANPIPGNEKLVARTVDNLFRLGAEVIYRPISGMHVSGHGSEEEIKLMLSLLKPTYLIPVHGEYRHQVYCARIAEQVGLQRENIFLVDPGTIMEFCQGVGCCSGSVGAGKIMVDGYGVGDVGNVVLRDRKMLSEEGIVVLVLVLDGEEKAIIKGPEIDTRGFVYIRESEELLRDARQHLSRVVENLPAKRLTEPAALRSDLREAAASFFYERTGRRPMILPIIINSKTPEDSPRLPGN